jgi:hypothetical protein
MPPKKNLRRKAPVIEVDDTDSGDHTSDQELDTDEDSAGSLVNFVVDDDAPVEFDESKAESLSDEEGVQGVELVESAVYVDGVRRSTRNRKPVERYVDSDYEELMCEDVDTDAVLESEEEELESEEEEDADSTSASESTTE